MPLSADGIKEAQQAALQLAERPIDVIFTSTLMRAQQTAMIVMSQHKSAKVPILLHEEGQMRQRTRIYAEEALENTIPVHANWHLNERYYGELQGANKAETMQKYGKEQVHIWRRSFDVPPPEGESLKMTCERTIPYFNEEILPLLQQGKSVFVAAHGNSLRSIIMHLEKMSPEDILQFELATGAPRIYDFVDESFHYLPSS